MFVDDSDDETPQVIQAARTRGFGSLDTRLLGTLREGFRYLRLLADIRLSLPPKLPSGLPACQRGWNRFGYVRTCP
jgi:hypothetical protein